MPTPDEVRAHCHSSRHREEVLSSRLCGCFDCLSTFTPSEILEWTDEWGGVGQTALCPRCGTDCVIGAESGYPVSIDFLIAMNRRWFGPSP